MIRLSATKAELSVAESETITSGAQRVFVCTFALSADWDGLDRTAVFRAGTQSVSVLLDGENTAVIPWEVLQTPGITLHIGLYGSGPDGLVLPTIWAEAGMIRYGAYPVGPQGPKGDTGPAVALDTTLTHEGEAADAKATGDAISAVKARLDEIPKIDDTAITTTSPWSSKNIVDMLCPPLEESGNPVVCYPVAGYPLGVKAKWEPVQDGSGTPSPENIRPIKGRDSVKIERCGENLIDSARVVGVNAAYGLTTQYVDEEITISGIYSGSAANASFNFMSLSYKLPLTTKFAWLDLETSGCALVDVRFTNEDRDHIAIDITECTNGEKVKISFYLIAYVGTTAPTTYTPYIGQTNTLTLPETVYGGEVDAVTGDGKRTWGIIDNYAGETIPSEWISDRDVYSADKNPTVGAQVAYRLAEPVPFTAAGAQPIPALAGANTVLTDADSVSVSGRADLIHIIRKMQENEDKIN